MSNQLPYAANKRFAINGLNGISDRTLEMHWSMSGPDRTGCYADLAGSANLPPRWDHIRCQAGRSARWRPFGGGIAILATGS
ncbi:MAG: hypothetical protein ACREX9_07195 [Gammaproteobacteria bacterium]